MTVRLVRGVTLPVSPLCSQENQRKVGDNIRSCEPMRVFVGYRGWRRFHLSLIR